MGAAAGLQDISGEVGQTYMGSRGRRKYMISDKLYELAFAYKRTRLWESIWDTEIFAVKLSDGRIGYITVTGAASRHYSLGVYIGSKGLDSLRIMARADQTAASPLEFQEQVLQQECLQCSFESKEELSEEEQKGVRRYAKANNIRLAGKGAYPQFTKYQKNLCPWFLKDQEDQDILCQALGAAVALAGMLEGKEASKLGLGEIEDEGMKIPMLEFREGTYVLTDTVLPEEEPRKLPAPLAGNEIGVAKLKKRKKSGVWECEIIRFPQPVRNEPEEVPFFPVFLLAVNSATGYLLPLPSLKGYEDNPEALVDSFIEGLLRQKNCPKEILVRDQRTYAFAEDLCQKVGIVLRMEEELEALDDIEEALLDRFSKEGEEELEDVMDMLDSMLDMDQQQLKSLPQDGLDQLKELMEQGMLPEEIEERLELIFDKMKGEDASAKRSAPGSIRQIKTNVSYVISVSSGTGCYRHIQISGDSTLFGLHGAILDAFGFMDDHAHAFFMDNRSWSNDDSYYAEDVERDLRLTVDYTLSQVNLYKGKQFKYIFDFGDEWIFQCKVLKVTDENTPEPLVVRSKGEAPEQYGRWEDEDE